jgi:hypothetical protein
VHLHVHVHVHAYAYVHVDPHTLTSCRSAPYREGRGRRSAPWAGTTVRRANGGGGPLPGCPHTQRSLKIRGPGRLGCGPPRLLRLHIGTEGGRCEARSGVSSCCAVRAPSRLGHCNIGRPVQRTPPSRGMLPSRYLDRGGQRGGIPAPRPDRTSPPKKGNLVYRYPQRFNWFESTRPPKTLHDYRSCPKSTVVPTCMVVNYLRT